MTWCAQPRRFSPLIVSKTGVGGQYGAHVDNALMGKGPARLRTGLSFTLFLTPPGEYDGGELVIDSDMPYAPSFKMPAGGAVLYATTSAHRVNPVTHGRRLAVVTWIESMIREPHKREIIADLAEAMKVLVEKKADGDAIRKLERGRLNLLRLWADT